MSTFHGKDIAEVGVYNSDSYTNAKEAAEANKICIFDDDLIDGGYCAMLIRDRFDTVEAVYKHLGHENSFSRAAQVVVRSGCKNCGTKKVWVDIPDYSCIED
mgnify:CR=1 FL=1